MEGDKAILPHDVIIEILKRLPVKSLIRFQSVCKLWKNLIKAPSFIINHLHHSSHKNPLLLPITSGFSYRFPLPLHLLDCHTMETTRVRDEPLNNSFTVVVQNKLSLLYSSIVGSCNGLVCVQLYCIDDHSQLILVWNPATRQIKQLLARTIHNGLSRFNVGFGFSSIVNDYKVVKVHFPTRCYDEHGHAFEAVKSYVNQAEVYSFSTRLWKELEVGVIQNVGYMHNAKIAGYETMFWLGLRNDDNNIVIVSFDIAMEAFTLIPTPIISKYSILDDQNKLTKYENKLAMLHHHSMINGNFESSFIDLWVLEENTDAFGKSNKSWSKKYNIGPIANWLRPICIWENEIVCNDIHKLSESEHGRILADPTKDESCCFIYLLHLTTNEIKRFNGFSFRGPDFGGIWNYYVESLVPVGTHIN